MKRLTYILLFFLPYTVGAQNHVPNGDFEYYIGCPNALTQIDSATGWRTFFNGTTPDYYNTCGTGVGKVPNIFLGYQYPVSGNAYAGLVLSDSFSWREIIAREIVPLLRGARYEVSLSVSRADSGYFAADNMTVFFYDTISVSSINLLSIEPQVNFQNYGAITDTLNWVRMVGVFQADSAYDNIAIGGFLHDTTINVIAATSNNFARYGYYYIDSIVVRPIPYIIINSYDTLLCTNDTFNLSYSTNFSHSSNNTFTAQLSDLNGSYQNPLNIGTKVSDTSGVITCILPDTLTTSNNYKIRIISSSPVDTSYDVNLPRLSIGNPDSVTINFSSNSPVCEGDTILFNQNNTPDYLTYSWTGPSNFTSNIGKPKRLYAQTSHQGSYYVNTHLYGCAFYDTIQVQIKPITQPVATTSSPICEYDTLNLTGSSTTNGVSYSWTGPDNYSSNQTNPTINNVSLLQHGAYILATSKNGCTRYDTALVIIKDSPDSVVLSSNTPVCINDTLHLTSTQSLGSVTYNWSGPNNFSATNYYTDTIINNINQAGWYVMTASNNGCTYTDSTQVAITPVPNPPVINSNNIVCEYDTLELTASSSTSGATYSWSGPNNYNSNSQNIFIPNISLSAGGQYIVAATKNNCSSKDTINITIKDAPDTITVSNNGPLCTGDTLRLFSDTSTGNVTYAWSGPSSFTSSANDTYIVNAGIVHTGWYHMTVSLNGCTYTDSTHATVYQTPAKPVISSDTIVCEYDTLQLSATSTTNGVTYSWVGVNNFSSSLQNPAISNTSLLASGQYIVSATKNNCTSKDSVSIIIRDAPDTITVSNNGPICTDDTLKLFSDTSTGNVLYTWSGPNSFTSSANDTQIVNAGIVHTGWYSMTVNLNGCTYTDSTYASVYQTPSAPTLSYNNPLCVGETLSLNANSLVSGVTYSWAGPGNFNSSVKSPVISNAQLSDTGNYTATVNYNGCISPVSTLPVTIKPTPFVVIYASPSDTICDGDNINILSIPANAGNNLSYAWRINAQLQTATGSTYSSTAFKDKDVIVCMMTDSTSCSDPYTDTSNDVQVNVLPWLAPSVSIVANPPGLLKPWEYVQFTATPTNTGNSPLYQWKRNGQDIIGATSNIWSANNLNDNDTIHVELISSYNCPQPANAVSNSIVVQIATGINEVAGFYNLTLSPNPNNGQFTLRGMVKQNGTATISVMNMVGQRIYHQQVDINQQQLQHEVDLNHVASGLYLLRLEMNGAVTHIKFEVK